MVDRLRKFEKENTFLIKFKRSQILFQLVATESEKYFLQKRESLSNVCHQGFATAWFNCAISVATAQLNQAVANPLDGIVMCFLPSTLNRTLKFFKSNNLNT